MWCTGSLRLRLRRLISFLLRLRFIQGVCAIQASEELTRLPRFGQLLHLRLKREAAKRLGVRLVEVAVRASRERAKLNKRSRRAAAFSAALARSGFPQPDAVIGVPVLAGRGLAPGGTELGQGDGWIRHPLSVVSVPVVAFARPAPWPRVLVPGHAGFAGWFGRRRRRGRHCTHPRRTRLRKAAQARAASRPQPAQRHARSAGASSPKSNWPTRGAPGHCAWFMGALADRRQARVSQRRSHPRQSHRDRLYSAAMRLLSFVLVFLGTQATMTATTGAQSIKKTHLESLEQRALGQPSPKILRCVVS